MTMVIWRPCAEKTGRWRGDRASGDARVEGELQGVEAELVDSSAGRGVAGGHGYGERRLRLCSGECAREGAEEGEGVQGESEGVERATWASSGSSRGAGGKQVTPWRARRRRGVPPLPTDRGRG